LTNGMAKVDGASRVGAKVHEVVPDTPADRAGIKPDDVITAIDGQTVGGAESLTGWVRTYSGGDEVTLTLVRDGEQQQVSVTLSPSGTRRSGPRRPAGGRVGAGRVGPDGVRPHCRPWGPEGTEGTEGPEGPVLGRSSGSRAHPSTPNADYCASTNPERSLMRRNRQIGRIRERSAVTGSRRSAFGWGRACGGRGAAQVRVRESSIGEPALRAPINLRCARPTHRASAARIGASFASDSSHSRSGSEAATIPQPANM